MTLWLFNLPKMPRLAFGGLEGWCFEAVHRPFPVSR